MPKNVIKGAVKGSREPAPNILGIFLTNFCDKGVSPVGDKKQKKKKKKKKKKKEKRYEKLPAVERLQRRATQRQDILRILYVSKNFTLSRASLLRSIDAMLLQKYQVIYFTAGETFAVVVLHNSSINIFTASCSVIYVFVYVLLKCVK